MNSIPTFCSGGLHYENVKLTIPASCVDNQAIVIPENVDAIRALSRIKGSWSTSIAQTNKSFNITQNIY